MQLMSFWRSTAPLWHMANILWTQRISSLSTDFTSFLVPLRYNSIDFDGTTDLLVKPMSLRPLMVVEEGPDRGRQFTTDAVQFRVGRSSDRCDFVLSDEDPAISREHFAVIRRGDTFLFMNLSRNGSSINGVRADQTLLKSNDLIKVGMQTVIRFTVEDERNLGANPSFGL